MYDWILIRFLKLFGESIVQNPTVYIITKLNYHGITFNVLLIGRWLWCVCIVGFQSRYDSFSRLVILLIDGWVCCFRGSSSWLDRRHGSPYLPRYRSWQGTSVCQAWQRHHRGHRLEGRKWVHQHNQSRQDPWRQKRKNAHLLES